MTDDNPPTPPLPPAGWYRDPMGQGDARYWDGGTWTDSVSRGGVTFQAAVPPDQLRVPPVPGSEYHTQPPAPQPAAQPAPVYAEPPRKSGGSSVLVGVIAAAAAVLIVVVILVSVTGGDDTDDESPTTDPPAEATDPPDGDDGGDGGGDGGGNGNGGDDGEGG